VCVNPSSKEHTLKKMKQVLPRGGYQLEGRYMERVNEGEYG
jgi:hypothetical protein